jgi:hypothetical protein
MSGRLRQDVIASPTKKPFQIALKRPKNSFDLS